MATQAAYLHLGLRPPARPGGTIGDLFGNGDNERTAVDSVTKVPDTQG
jgi:hypothetical protein